MNYWAISDLNGVELHEFGGWCRKHNRHLSMIIVLMGVTGSGKTTVGRLLAEDLGWTYVDADDFHSELNIEKMKGGIPLNDADRKPWFAKPSRIGS